MTDVELLREALAALETETKRAHLWDYSGACRGQRPECTSVHCVAARAAIAKLEQRLLNE